MVQIDFERDVPVSAQRMWAVLEDFGNMAWAAGGKKTELIGDGIGMTRRLHMDGMDPIDEVLQSMDPANMTFSYSIPRGLPLPVSDYIATARLQPLDAGNTRVHWSCTCTPDNPEQSLDALESMIHATYNLLVDMVTGYLAQTTPAEA